MPGGQLPEGLVTTNNETVGEEIANVNRIDLEDVARLWRDYSTSRALLHDNTGDRLANFFWRIWSNTAVSNSIPGSTVARLFMTISQGGNRVRTTPVPSPRPTSPASRDTTPTPSSPHTVAESIPETDVADFSALTSSPPQAIAESVSDIGDTPTPSEKSPSTLKHAGSISDSTSTSSKSSTSPSGTLSPTSPTSPTDKSLSNGSKKRAAIITTSRAKAKTRPSLPRRKSSQGPSSVIIEPKRSPKLPAKKSPSRSPSLKQIQAVSTGIGGPRIAPPPGLPSIPSTTTSFALPSTSWQDVSSPASSQIGIRDTAATSQQPSSWLVDTNFRSKFVENQNRGASSTNLLGLGKSKSTVRFADQLPGRKAARGDSDTQAIASVSNGTKEAATLNAQARPRRGSGAIADDDDDDDDDQSIVSLPRTKSQLSVMIDRERRRSGTHELRPSPLQQEVRKGTDNQRGSTTKDEDDDDDDDDDEGDDDLLTMARKEGVTKAGTISSKTRGTQKLSPKSHDKFHYQSPPTPPLY